MRISDWSSDVCSSDLERDDDEHRQEGAAVGVDRLDHHGGHARGEHAADADHAVGERGTRQGAVAEAEHGEAEQGEGGGDHCERSGPVSVSVPSSSAAPSMSSRSEEHTSELQSLMRISYAVFCLNKK